MERRITLSIGTFLLCLFLVGMLEARGTEPLTTAELVGCNIAMIAFCGLLAFVVFQFTKKRE